MKPRNPKSLKCGDCGFRARSQVSMTVHKRMHVRKKSIAAQNTITVPTNSSRKRPHAIRNDAEIIQVLEEDNAMKKECEIKYIFSCPKCNNLNYDYYVQAYRHIQAHHCYDSSGIPVNKDSPDLIKPIRKEICPKCELAKTPGHHCFNKVCNGCQKQFPNLDQFYIHIRSRHHHATRAYCFKTFADFTKWLRDMEDQTKCRYKLNLKNSAHGNLDCKFHYYLCHHDGLADDRICPSALFVQEFEKYIQVHFYKHHYGHKTKSYVESDTDAIPSIETKQFSDYTAEDQKGLYADFKVLLSTLMQASAQLDMTNLKLLYDKALDMLLIVNNCPPTAMAEPAVVKVEKDTPVTDDAVKVECRTSKRLKDNMDTKTVVGMASEVCSPKIVKTFTLKEESDLEEESERVTHEKRQKGPNDVSSPRGFDKATVPLKKYVYEEHEKAKVRGRQRKDQASKSIISSICKIDVAENQSKDTTSNNTIRSGFASFNDTYKDFVENTIGTPIVKKERIRTKLGQFSPKCKSEKVEKEKPKTTRRSLPAPAQKARNVSIPIAGSVALRKDSIDIKNKNKCRGQLGDVLKYEVMERDEDCNILILKF